MATGGQDIQEARLERRNNLKEDKKGELQTTLEQQGVYLSDEDISDIHVDQEEIEATQDPDHVFGSQPSLNYSGQGETDEEEEDFEHVSSAEIKERTDIFIQERSRIEQRFLEIERRESLAKLREQDLENRRLTFERTLKENEESERRKMKQRLKEERKKRQQEMYQDNIRILKELEQICCPRRYFLNKEKR